MLKRIVPILLLAGCLFDPHPMDGALACGDGNSCPDGYTCVSGRCWTLGHEPGDAAASADLAGGSGVVDAAVSDAPVPQLDGPPVVPPDMSATCSDGVTNGNETDVDCGGSCSACALGKMCKLDGDCGTGHYCHATMNQCVADPCADGKKDGAETAVDCGGGSCGGC